MVIGNSGGGRTGWRPACEIFPTLVSVQVLRSGLELALGLGLGFVLGFGFGFGLGLGLGVRITFRVRVRNILDRNKRGQISWTGTSVEKNIRARPGSAHCIPSFVHAGVYYIRVASPVVTLPTSRDDDVRIEW